MHAEARGGLAERRVASALRLAPPQPAVLVDDLQLEAQRAPDAAIALAQAAAAPREWARPAVLELPWVRAHRCSICSPPGALCSHTHAPSSATSPEAAAVAAAARGDGGMRRRWKRQRQWKSGGGTAALEAAVESSGGKRRRKAAAAAGVRRRCYAAGGAPAHGESRRVRPLLCTRRIAPRTKARPPWQSSHAESRCAGGERISPAASALAPRGACAPAPWVHREQGRPSPPATRTSAGGCMRTISAWCALVSHTPSPPTHHL